MQHNRESRYSLLYLMKNIQTNLRFLSRFKFICAVRCTYRDSERINSSLLYKILNLFRLSISMFFCLYIILNPCKYSELTLNSNIIFMSIFNYSFGKSYILFVRKMRTIYHDRREAHFYTRLAKFESISVVEMENYRNIESKFFSILNTTLRHIS